MADILVIEDGAQERERLEKLFAAANYSVRAADTVESAEELLKVESFRLAVLDIGLADKSGSYLFELMKRTNQVPYVIIFTGNPSIHLKQRFIEEGASAYIVKASPAAENEALLDTVRSFLGVADVKLQKKTGIPLEEFLRGYVTDESRELFLDLGNKVPPCSECGARDFLVTFAHKTQLPPIVEGSVICENCSAEFDPEVG